MRYGLVLGLAVAAPMLLNSGCGGTGRVAPVPDTVQGASSDGDIPEPPLPPVEEQTANELLGDSHWPKPEAIPLSTEPEADRLARIESELRMSTTRHTADWLRDSGCAWAAAAPAAAMTMAAIASRIRRHDPPRANVPPVLFTWGRSSHRANA